MARTETFTSAARELSIAQSAVTAQIKQLEDALGLKLIDRSNRRRYELTEEGIRILEYANSIFETSRELLRWATKGKAPKETIIRIGAISSLSRNLQYEFLAPVLSDVGVKIEVKTGDQENLIRLLQEHALDVVLTSHNVASRGKALFYSHVLISSPLIFVTRIKRNVTKNVELRSFLNKKPLFVPGTSFEIRPELDAYLKSLNIPVRIAGEIDDIALLRILAMRSGAVVALPEMGVKSDIEDDEILVLGRADNLEQKFYAITRRRVVPNKVIEDLILNMRDGRDRATLR